MTTIHELCVRARAAARAMATRTTADKNALLHRIAGDLLTGAQQILAANAEDVAAAEARGLSPAMVDRLRLDHARLKGIADAVKEVASLPDPTGEVVSRITRPNGLLVERLRVPLGVIAMIYESRPNVTSDASALALKAGNAVILRGGSEALRSNVAIGDVVRRALLGAGFPEDAVQIIPVTSREAMVELLHESELVDLAIPRGGEALIRFVTENARVPVVQHYRGVCHMFVDRGYPAAQAVKIVRDAKLVRPSACNALECLLVHQDVAAEVLPGVADALLAEGGELRGCARTLQLLGARPNVTLAKDEDYGFEFLAKVLAVKVVPDLDAALLHIQRFGSSHTEAILTHDQAHALRFRTEVDAACLVWNASTRFHDGGELGLGAEIGIATSRLHWRGPMGLESLTTMKWVVSGEGQIRG
jgi:glutamate-5-semialdehyde dehydrogenase